MSTFDVCQINTSKLDDTNKLPLVQATVPITNDEDYESFGEVAGYQALGVTALPYPPDDAGAAEGVVLRDVGNLTGAIIGARDERCAGVVANMQPGDAVLHSCDPQAKAQVRVHANRQVALVTEGTDGKTMLSLLDGKNDKITITAFGGLIEMTKDGINIVAPGSKASILLKGDQIILLGNVQIGTATATASFLAGDKKTISVIQGLITAVDPTAKIGAASNCTTSVAFFL